MSHALVLNASFEPLHIVTWQRAIQLLFQGKVEVVEESDHEVRTVRFTIKVPAVLRLLTYVPLSKRKELVRFSRVNIFLRDQGRCQYCGTRSHKSHLTLDHVIPIVQGGKKCWENIVTACKSCNQKKGGRTPSQAGMQLIRKPKKPTWLPAASLQMGITLTSNGAFARPNSRNLAKNFERWKIYFKLQRNSPLADEGFSSDPDEAFELWTEKEP